MDWLSFLGQMNPFTSGPGQYDPQGMYSESPSVMSRAFGQLPQPTQVFAPGQQPVYQPGWGELLDHLGRTLTGYGQPPQHPQEYWDDPSHWPPGQLPYGPRG